MQLGDFVTCACGKRGYPSRKLARRAARSRSITGVNAYRCQHPGRSPEYEWHVGHLPPRVKESVIPRHLLGVTATRQSRSWRGERLEPSKVPPPDPL